MTAKRGFVACLAVLLGCGGAAPEQLKAGKGIKIDSTTEMISVDDAVVPAAADCATGQVLQRTANGWACTAAAPDAAQLGGKPASSYVTSDGTVANATTLAGHAASYFLAASAKAADSMLLNGHSDADFLPAAGTAMNSAALNGHPDTDFLGATATAANCSALNGHPDSYFLPAASVAADSAKLGGQPASYYLPAAATAVNSSRLNGQPASFYLPASATAVNSAALNGQPASYYLPATATAVDSSKLGGVLAGNYVRADQAANMKGGLTIQNSIDPGIVKVGDFNGGVFGSNVFGNLHLDADSTKADGHIYFNWYEGNGVRFGNGAQSKVAEIDGSGNVTAASYNGVQISSANVTATSYNGLQISTGQFTASGPIPNCDAACVSQGGSCLAAKGTNSGGVITATTCSTTYAAGLTLRCACGKF